MTILTNATPEQIEYAIVANYCRSHREVLAEIDGRQTEALFNIDGFISGIPYMMMNSLFDCPPDFTPIQVEAVLAYYKLNHLPLMWFVSPRGLAIGLDKVLDEMGVELAKMKVPGMVADLNRVDIDILHSKKGGHQLVTVDISDPDKLSIYTNIFMQAFEVDPAIGEEMQGFSRAFPQHPTSSHYFVILDGQPVATASVIYESGVAGVYNVATLPGYQRKGLASALMATLMLEAKDKGYQYSILHSSERGKVVYERLGYEVAFWFKRYLMRPIDVGL